ncbi:glyoxylase-like metal-dependent hydrolase (beta-lactamase superfamily II) [Halopolyspora algeriensis]|uniref:Glyoxylase-like metal-dependent hydrolase (Beta-lactamase superfamily II) n=1 Tax=Halopolyspora algeriensis TaxID=1500506 RepID=A0A368VSZ2_9ACTN|nr:MBL fold metallo-hydrolase [Halopolyspora algeriensis]RCW45100.1 glyoxylase-like metal-dependent hydrolase (beta-lactamase superfamily II) [Halopolyspora algeriensis]TQM53178.1 glyoxylase-like metal-dependent hydrolase (beta-lactamase superfamily II) [Halopolyspora algeriensis]
MSRWTELADGVLVRRYAELDLSVGLVLGSEQALVIDTRGDTAQGAELAGAARQVTSLPWQVVLTHAHFDHCFGTAAFLPAPVRAHARCAAHLRQTAAAQRAEWAAHYRAEGHHETARALAATEPVLPGHEVHAEAALDLGDRTVRLVHPGSGHTDHDLVVHVPDAAVVFAGDLVEHGAPPAFEDSHPLEWSSSVDALLRLQPSTVVPGHGDPVDREFVRGQRDELASLAKLCRAVAAGSLTETEALRHSPYPAETTRTALGRAID